MNRQPPANLVQLVRTGEIAPHTNPSLPLPSKPALERLVPRSNDLPELVLNAETIDLGVARDATRPLSLQLRGNLLAVNYTTLASNIAQIRINGQGSYLTVGPGWRVLGGAFDLVEIINAAQTDSSMELVYALDSTGLLDIRYR